MPATTLLPPHDPPPTRARGLLRSLPGCRPSPASTFARRVSQPRLLMQRAPAAAQHTEVVVAACHARFSTVQTAAKVLCCRPSVHVLRCVAGPA
jgi:hypothetical protein